SKEIKEQSKEIQKLLATTTDIKNQNIELINKTDILSNQNTELLNDTHILQEQNTDLSMQNTDLEYKIEYNTAITKLIATKLEIAVETRVPPIEDNKKETLVIYAHTTDIYKYKSCRRQERTVSSGIHALKLEGYTIPVITIIPNANSV